MLTGLDQKMSDGTEKVIYRGNKTPTAETRLPEVEGEAEITETIEEGSSVDSTDTVVDPVDGEAKSE